MTVLETSFHLISAYSEHILTILQPSLDSKSFDMTLGCVFLTPVLSCINSRWNLPVGLIAGIPTFSHLDPPWPWPGLLLPLSSDNLPFFHRFLYALSLPMVYLGSRSILRPHIIALQSFCPTLTTDFAIQGPGIHYPYIVKTVIGFEFSRVRMPLTEYVGPLLSKNPIPLSENTALKEWLESKPNRSVVYVSMGSRYQLSKENGRAVLEGVMQTNLSLLWSLKKKNQGILEGLHYDSKRVFVSDWTPQFSVLGSSTIHSAVLHGGFGGLTEALWHGVPIVGFPQSVEQKVNVGRLYHSGLGLMLDKESFTASNIARHVDELDKGHYRHKIKLHQKMVELAGGSKRAADLVEFYADVGYTHMVPAYVKYNWNWIQYYNADVWLLVAGTMLLCGFLFYKCLMCIAIHCWSCLQRKTKTD